MPIIPKHSALAAQSDEQLIAAYDRAAESAVAGTNFFMDELSRRAATRQANEMQRMTKQMRDMTIVVTVLTIVNVILVAVTLT